MSRWSCSVGTTTTGGEDLVLVTLEEAVYYLEQANVGEDVYKLADIEIKEA